MSTVFAEDADEGGDTGFKGGGGSAGLPKRCLFVVVGFMWCLFATPFFLFFPRVSLCLGRCERCKRAKKGAQYCFGPLSSFFYKHVLACSPRQSGILMLGIDIALAKLPQSSPFLSSMLSQCG
jgi:hypothetical protein